MIKLKGGDDKNSIMNQAAKRMGLPMANSGPKASQSHTSPGSHHAYQSQHASQSAIPSGPTPIAQRLGMPSAQKGPGGGEKKDGKDWSSKSNRINLGAPVYIQSKSQQAQYGDQEVLVDDRPKHKLGDVTQHSDEENDSDNDVDDSDEKRVLASLRAQRLNELKKVAGKQQEWLALGHGQYTNIDQDSFLKSVTGSKYVICHFYHSSFDRCKIVDHHLEQLSRSHLPTRFVKIDAEKSPFFVGKLQIKVLPTIVCFKDGIAVDRVIGFEELGGDDEFPTSVLEKRLAKSGCLIAKDSEVEKPINQNVGAIRAGLISQLLDEDIDNIDDDDD